MNYITRYAQNTLGRDLIVGDIHGCFSRLQHVLDTISFNPEVDRLFSVGDLVDRGPESELCLEWLAKPWFKAVRGNHEAMSIDIRSGHDMTMLAMNGGAWIVGKPKEERDVFIDAFESLPIVIEIETAQGLVGIVHANCPTNDWCKFVARLNMGGLTAETAINAAIWDRSRIENSFEQPVENIRAVVCGHTPLDEMQILGNVYHIDTMGWRRGLFTILDAATLQPVHP